LVVRFRFESTIRPSRLVARVSFSIDLAHRWRSRQSLSENPAATIEFYRQLLH
jgi:hypothetical protein